MKPQDTAGRIDKDDFIVSTAVLLALALIATVTRFVIRFHIQKLPFSVDDGLLLVAVACVIISLTIMYVEVIDNMYFVAALQSSIAGVELGENWVEISYDFHKWVTVTLMTSWAAIMAVKFSFMFFFKKLINRLPKLDIFWWFVMVFQVGCLGYGISVFYIGCPYYNDPRLFQCPSGKYKSILVHHSIAQMTVDLLGDVLILVMPVAIIWQIRVHWTQKLAFTLSLCLTAVMIAFTIIRVSGLVYHDRVDIIWEVYWQLMAAEVGVFLAAATAFRGFFVARSNRSSSNNNRYRAQEKMKYFFADSFVAKFAGSRERRNTDSFGDTLDDTKDDRKSRFRLPRYFPRAQLSGMRTFIDRQGRTDMTSQTLTVHEDDTYNGGYNGGSYATDERYEAHIPLRTLDTSPYHSDNEIRTIQDRQV